MTVRAPAWLQNGSYTADNDRLLLQSLLGGSPNQALSPGVVGLADYKVTQTGTPSMNLGIASGSAWIVGSQSSTEGVYNVVNDDSTATVTISTPDATNPRIDLVVLQVRNQEYSGTNNDAVLAVVTGTPAASPVAPSAPADSIILAQIAVAHSVSSIVTANITDKRPFFSPLNIARGTPAAGLHLNTTISSPVQAVATQIVANCVQDFAYGGFTTTPASGIMTAPVTGLYDVEAQWVSTAAASAGGAEAYCGLWISGAQAFQGPGNVIINAAFLGAAARRRIPIFAGQTIGWGYFLSIVPSIQLNGNVNTSLSAVLVSA